MTTQGTVERILDEWVVSASIDKLYWQIHKGLSSFLKKNKRRPPTKPPQDSCPNMTIGSLCSVTKITMKNCIIPTTACFGLKNAICLEQIFKNIKII